MSTWIEINGAKVEKEFFEENVREARGYEWAEIRSIDLVDHGHCLICGVTIDSRLPTTVRAYKSKGGHVCAYCYDHFLSG
jgi:hypothetical protein